MMEGNGFRDEFKKFQDNDIQIWGISADSVNKQKKFAYSLPRLEEDKSSSMSFAPAAIADIQPSNQTTATKLNVTPKTITAVWTDPFSNGALKAIKNNRASDTKT